MRPLDVESLPLAGTSVIEASAGTGKTYTITSLFLRLLIERELPVDGILVVTYTRAATAELRDRVRARLALALRCAQGEAVDDAFVSQLCRRARERDSARLLRTLEAALANIEQAAILTIHAFCQRVLRDHAFESRSGFGLSVTAHSAPLIDEIASDYYTAQLFDTSRLRAQQLTGELTTLRALAARAGSSGSVRIVPEPEALGLPSLDAWRSARDACLQAWQTDRARVLELVRGWAGPSSRHVSNWAAALDRLLASEDFGVSRKGHRFHSGFRYFTASFAATKARQPVSHPLLLAADQLWEEDARLCAALGAEKVAFRAGFADYLRRELQRRAQSTEVCTFDALISEVGRALAGPHRELLLAALRNKYQAALVDEFQDTDPAQYQMFRQIFAEAGRALLLIGDPKQAIYAFRGADVQAYLAAREDAGEHVYTLGVNRRSDPALIEALNALYARVERPFLREEIEYHPVSAPTGMPVRFMAPDAHGALDLALLEVTGSEESVRREIARRVAADIARLLSSGARRCDERHGRVRALRASDVAVLCRTNREAHEVQLALSAAFIPAVLSGDSSVFDSEDAEHLERVLSALAHPAEPRALRAFLGSIYAGLTAEDLLALEHDDGGWDMHARRFRELHELFVARGFTQAIHGLCARYQVEERLLARPDGLRRLTNLNHLLEILAQVSLSERLGPLGLLRWLMTARRDADLRAELVAESHELRLESSDNAVQLTTVHKSKGLEYPVVYCPFLYKAATLRPEEKQLVRFHDPEDGALSLDVGGPRREQHAQLAEQEALAEALRLLYVALTRAKHRVVVAIPSHKPAAKSALMYTLLGGGDGERVHAQLEQAGGGAGLSALLAPLSSAVAGGISLRSMPALGSDGRIAHAGPPETLGVRQVRRKLDNTVRTASFSALTAERSGAHDSAADYDAIAANEVGVSQPEATLVLDAFPRGAGPGKLIHEILERCAFDGSDEALRELVQQVLTARGADLALGDALTRGLLEMLRTPLDSDGLSLSRLGASARVNELEFLFPVASTLTPRRLGRCFRDHAAPAADPAYARRLESLSFEDLRGQLRGFIDLVFEHEGRFYLVDYKSNRLGPHAGDYAEVNLVRAMSEHHYFLQYHLYTLALHRYLQQRVAGYDYERHFGGVYYLFLRGMAPPHPARTGVFFDRPPHALITALDQSLRQETAAPSEVRP